MSTRDSVPLDEGDARFLTGAAPEPVLTGDSSEPAPTPGPVLLDEDWRDACQVISPAEINPQTYFCTFTCYGTWLHGSSRGSIDRDHNEWLTPALEPDEERERSEFHSLKHSPVKLGPRQRVIVHATVVKVCTHRGWRLHALNVRTNHVHAVVTVNRKGKRILNDFKSYATRRLKEAVCLPEACLEVLAPRPSSSSRNRGPSSSRARKEAETARSADRRPLPDGRGSRAQSSEIQSLDSRRQRSTNPVGRVVPACDRIYALRARPGHYSRQRKNRPRTALVHFPRAAPVRKRNPCGSPFDNRFLTGAARKSDVRTKPPALEHHRSTVPSRARKEAESARTAV